MYATVALVALLSAVAILLYCQKQNLQQQNRQLIVQNDSIMSVNILLADSLKNRSLGITNRQALKKVAKK